MFSHNPYQWLRDLNASETIMVATVIAANSDGTSQVQLLEGGTLKVIGHLIGVGGRCLIQNGVMIGQGPSGDIVTVDV